MSKYFDKFPLVNYNGVVAKNILSRVNFTDDSKRDIYSNFDYTISDGNSRPDILSNNYYNSPYYDWLIYISNNIIDPYYDYYISSQDLNGVIIAKYGSILEANRKILYYRNNWSPDDSVLTPSLYDSIDISYKKYYKPLLNNSNQVTGYIRHKEDWIQSTNKIIELTLSSIEGLKIDDVYYYGTITNIDEENSIITVHHITGDFVINSEVLKINIILENISTEEASFWTPVTAYDYEVEKNELKKYINVIKSSYLPDIENKFSELMKS